MRTACVLIPAHNEADRVADTVRAARSLDGISKVIVIDDFSTDDTADVAQKAGADLVLRLERNLGKGGALQAGFIKTDHPVILMLDADLGQTATLAQELLTPVLDDRADMTVAVFPELATTASKPKKGGGFGFAMRLSRFGIKALTGRDFKAPLSGQRAVDRRIIEDMGGFGRGFGVETAMSGWAASAGWRIFEVPLDMKHRRTGKNLAGFIHRGRQLLHIARALVWLLFVRKRAAGSRIAR